MIVSIPQLRCIEATAIPNFLDILRTQEAAISNPYGQIKLGLVLQLQDINAGSWRVSRNTIPP
jgi:hypothetical protein